MRNSATIRADLLELDLGVLEYMERQFWDNDLPIPLELLETVIAKKDQKAREELEAMIEELRWTQE